MNHFQKLKAKFEDLVLSDHGQQGQPGPNRGYYTQGAGYQQQQQQQQQQRPYPPEQTPGQNSYAPGPTGQGYPPGDGIGPGGFYVPPAAANAYGNPSTMPAFPGAPYPPPSQYGTQPYPPAGPHSAYPPPYSPSNQQTPLGGPGSRTSAPADNKHDNQSGQNHPSSSASLTNEMRDLSTSDVPPGVPLPLDQHDINPEVENGTRSHVFSGETGSAGGKDMVFLNIKPNELVHQRFLIVYGQVPGIKGNDDKVVVRHPYFPPLTFPAVNGYFKVLAELENGDNGLMFEYLHGQECICKGQLNVKMTPYLDKPPLLLSVMLGRDSKGIFDAPPNARGPGINDLDAAMRKFRCCVYMWQAFMAEQLYRQGFGRRTFRLEEYYEPDTMARDNAKRMTARIHVVRSKLSVAELQDKELAQQWKEPPGYKRKIDKSLFGVAGDALTDYGAFKGKHYIVCLIADSRWDPQMGVLLGHAALGGGGGDRRLGVFGSHTTHSWPANAEEIAAKLLDTTKTDTRYLVNDCNECGEYWRAANIGMGAFLHECGHMLTLSHTPTGIMLRGFNDYNRTFMARSPNWDGPVRQRDEAGSHWHRTDIIRLRHHPCLRLPSDPPLQPNELDEGGFDILPLDAGLQIQSENGITLIEVWVNSRYRIHREYTAENLEQRRNGSLPADQSEKAASFPLKVIVDLEKWRGWAGGWEDSDNIELVLTSRGTSTFNFKDVYAFIRQTHERDSSGNVVIKANQLGQGAMKDSEKFSARFSSKSIRSSLPKLRAVEVHSGTFIDGIKFVMEDGSKQQVGRCLGGNLTVVPIEPDDDLDHIIVRSGWWIDGLEFITTRGRSSGWKGGNGGNKHVLKPPAGYGWMGLSGSGAGWLDSLTMHYSKCI
ncbi:hypothetical protein IW138_005929 [Coemansia sp. RSA 986]|nr:hypothetical protein IW138_005929 [Coemansia sp. RSA 986]